MYLFYFISFLSILQIICADPFDEKVAVEMWDLNSLTYCNQEQINTMTCQKCIPFKDRLTHVKVIQRAISQTYGFIGLWEDKDIIISFRGTEGVVNIIEDLTSATLTNTDFCQDCQVSKTFYTIYKILREELLTTVGEYLQLRPNASLVLTGHSSGAVYASFSAIDIINKFSYSRNRNTAIQCRFFYSYGLPRIGNTQFVEYMHSMIPTHYRITHAKDIIPLLPPTLVGFHHTGDEYWYNTLSTSYKYCPYPEKKDCINTVIFPSTSDHNVYMGSLKGNCQ